jgi:4-hydroxythreonine-4-phosphate dehydrogenase
MNKFIFTCGDINGIGPEIVIKALNKIAADSPSRLESDHVSNPNPQDSFIFICPKNIFEETIKRTPAKFNFQIENKFAENESGRVLILNIKNAKLQSGKPTKDSGKAAFKAIKLSSDILHKKKADAVITAPISKAAIRLAGYNYPGHTEMYAEWSKTKNFVMLFVSKELKAGLITIHEPIKAVPKLLSAKNIENKIKVVIYTLINDLNILNPKVAVLGLNPHAGEGGLIGTEEKKIIAPLILKSEFAKYLSEPFSPDAFFGSMAYKKYDLVLGMYHDQVLIPFKLLSFSSGVNYTAGLPIVRTSPDHGVAYDIAGKNVADESSILEAFYLAEKIVQNRKKNAFRKNI